MMFQKTYMSRAVTRVMAIDHPIGDPTGGVAFGERNEPVSAAISIFTMLSTAEAGFAAMTLMQGVAFAGAAVSLVGNVTGNKTLMQLGAVAGIVGGLGMTGVFGETAKGATLSSLTGSPAAATTTGANAAGAAAESVSRQVTPFGGFENVPDVSLGSVPAVGNAQLSPLTSQSLTASPVGTTPISDIISTSPVVQSSLPGNAVTPLAATGDATTAYNTIVPADQLGNQGGAFGVNINPTGIAGNNPPAIGPQTMYEKALGYGKQALDFTKTNPTAAGMLGKTVGAVGDWLTGKTDAELEALKAQSSLYGARGEQIRYEIESEKQKRANLNAGYTNVNAGIKVNPNAGITQPWSQQGPGLINAARTTG